MTEEVRQDNMPFQKGVDIPYEHAEKTWEFLLDQGKQLKDTAFVKGGEFTEDDIDILKQFYQEAYDFQRHLLDEDGAVFNRSLQRHLLLAERYAEIGARRLKLDINLMRALVLAHDFGRLFSHRRGRNDAIEFALFRKLGFSDDFIKLLPQDDIWTSDSEMVADQMLKDMTQESGGITAAVILFDVLGKWKEGEQGPLRRWEDVVPQSESKQKQPDKTKMWPSEYSRQEKVIAQQGITTWQHKYEFIKNWFESRTGKNIDSLVQEVENSLQTNKLPENWAESKIQAD